MGWGHDRQRRRLGNRQGWICPWCLQPITREQFRDTSRDHVIPKSHGGDGRMPNLQLLHGECNAEKGDQCPGCDWCRESKLTGMGMLEAAATRLRGGEDQVTIRPRGFSMTPLIMSGQEVAVHQMKSTDDLKIGAIVLARVSGRVLLHKILAIDEARQRVQIGNNHGRVNGWTPFAKVFGIAEPPRAGLRNSPR
jgi:HNH endonuclease